MTDKQLIEIEALKCDHNAILVETQILTLLAECRKQSQKPFEDVVVMLEAKAEEFRQCADKFRKL